MTLRLSVTSSFPSPLSNMSAPLSLLLDLDLHIPSEFELLELLKSHLDHEPRSRPASFQSNTIPVNNIGQELLCR
jgi:hypothetical protein